MDKESISFIAENAKHISVNKWLVQLIVKDKWYSAYFGVPEVGTPKILYKSKTEAMIAVIEGAMEYINE